MNEEEEKEKSAVEYPYLSFRGVQSSNLQNGADNGHSVLRNKSVV